MSSERWSGYDDVAATFRSVVEPAFFAAPAERLVSLLPAGAGSKVLDAGAGTGAVGRAARARGADVVSLDLSLSMLLENPPGSRRVLASLPELPLRDGRFTHVTAAFVLSHLAEPERFLADAARVLGAGGAAGAASWAEDASQSAAGQIWFEAVSEVVPMDTLMAEIGPVLPNESALASLEGMAALFDRGGFEVSHAGTEAFLTSMAAPDFIRSRTAGSSSRYLRSVLTPAGWGELQAEGLRRIESRLGTQLEIATRVNFVVGRPAGSRDTANG